MFVQNKLARTIYIQNVTKRQYASLLAVSAFEKIIATEKGPYGIFVRASNKVSILKGPKIKQVEFMSGLQILSMI